MRWRTPCYGERVRAWLALSLLGSASVGLLAFGCSAATLDVPSGSFSGDGDGDVGVGDGDGDGDGFDPNTPEEELEETFRAPVVVGKYLFSANPDSNRVARIDSETLEIDVYEGGHAPTYLAGLPPHNDGGGALVLNVRSHDASVFRLDEAGALVSQDRIEVQAGASAWAVGATGKYAVAWSRASDALLSDGDGYQDLTVLNLTDDVPTGVPLSVGFRPSQVMIDEAETYAYVVSEPGISVISLADGISVARELFLPEVEDQTTRDVSLTKDGKLALVRLAGSADILLVDTETDERVTLTMPAVVTDLDLSADGTLAVAVMRGGQIVEMGMGGAGGAGEPVPAMSAVALLPVATIFDSPGDYALVATQELVGSAVVAEDASRVFLFTNATPNHRLSILMTEDLSLRVVDLKAPVRAAFLSENGEHGVALMSTPPGSTRAGAFALIPVAKALSPKIEGTDTKPLFVSLTAEVDRALIVSEATTATAATAYFARFPGLQVDRIALPSRPLAAGIIAESGQGFVAQQHSEGRVTLIDLDAGAEKTITGFELSSKVVE